MCAIIGTTPPCEIDNVTVERLADVPALSAIRIDLDLPVLTPNGEKPRVLMLVDRRGWAYDTAAQAISKRLADEFEFRIEYVRENPDLNAWKFDLIYVFFWGETYHQKFVRDPRRVVKEVSSHRWELEDQYGRLSPMEMVRKHLADAGTVTCTSRRLCRQLAPYRRVLSVANGIDPEQFRNLNQRTGPLRLGWAGNQDDPCKGLHEILRPAANGDFELRIAGGQLSPDAMRDFYNSVDVLCVASTAEGTPLPLIESMACGCFPVTVDVGVVPELIKHRQNGLVVEPDVAAFRAAFQWCAINLTRVREAGAQNAKLITSQRPWECTAELWRGALKEALASAGWPGNKKPTARSVAAPSASAERATSNTQPVDELKNGYFDHLHAINPGGSKDETYQASIFYYDAELVPLLPTDKNARCVDLGCGFGHLLRFLIERGYRRCGGVEIDPQLHLACAHYVGSRLEFLEHADARTFIQQRAQAFDFVTLFDVIEHFSLAEALELCRGIHRALRPGGKVVLRTPNMANVFGIYSRYIDLTHQLGFTEQSLTQLLRHAGFAEPQVALSEWEPGHPLTAKLRESAEFHRKLLGLQDRATPKCFEKNLVLWACK